MPLLGLLGSNSAFTLPIGRREALFSILNKPASPAVSERESSASEQADPQPGLQAVGRVLESDRESDLVRGSPWPTGWLAEPLHLRGYLSRISAYFYPVTVGRLARRPRGHLRPGQCNNTNFVRIAFMEPTKEQQRNTGTPAAGC